jgi:hypothetical protein
LARSFLRNVAPDQLTQIDKVQIQHPHTHTRRTHHTSHQSRWLPPIDLLLAAASLGVHSVLLPLLSLPSIHSRCGPLQLHIKAAFIQPTSNIPG